MSHLPPEFRVPVPYAVAQSTQRALVTRRRDGVLPDVLWLLEHPLTVTLGTSGKDGHLLERAEALRARGVAIHRSERGGDVTCHEPGQLVGYPIVDLRGPDDRDLHEYLRRLEEGLLSYLDSVGVRGVRVPGRTGVWIHGIPARKIAAMGVRVQGWVTSHGFALNVENSLRGFELIVPCGIRDAEVTSLSRELGGVGPEWSTLCRGVHEAMEAALRRPLQLVLGTQALALAEVGPPR